jgi:hypothetical protein
MPNQEASSRRILLNEFEDDSVRIPEVAPLPFNLPGLQEAVDGRMKADSGFLQLLSGPLDIIYLEGEVGRPCHGRILVIGLYLRIFVFDEFNPSISDPQHGDLKIGVRLVDAPLGAKKGGAQRIRFIAGF